MNPDPGSLDNLRDLALPPAVPLWPPAPGVWIVIACVCAIVAVAVYRAFRRHSANAFRRAALAELTTLPGAAGGAAIERASAIMKRASIVAFGRETVAALSGAAWADFICQRATPGVDPQLVRRALAHAFDGRAEVDAADFVAQARRWVAHLEAAGGRR